MPWPSADFTFHGLPSQCSFPFPLIAFLPCNSSSRSILPCLIVFLLWLKSSVSGSPLGSCIWFQGNVVVALFPESCLFFSLLHRFHLKREQRQIAHLYLLAHTLVSFHVYWHAVYVISFYFIWFSIEILLCCILLCLFSVSLARLPAGLSTSLTQALPLSWNPHPALKQIKIFEGTLYMF